MYFFGCVSLYVVVAFTIVFNTLMFFISPWIQDWLMRWLYKARFYTVDEFRNIAPEISETVESVSREYGFKPPRIILIPDRNPTAFTYGSTRSRARIAVSEGIIKYLDPDERRAVVAHELGHIVHYDFAIMAIATTLLQVIYEIYVWSKHAARSSSSGSGRKKGSSAAIFAVIALASYIFYIIGRYIVLYLSRTREYYADEFAAQKTSPKSLASALMKVAYGIVAVPDDIHSRRLLRSTEALGIMGEKAAKEGALLVEYLEDYPNELGKVLAWDVYSPWAFIAELSSTHPLTGKRILRLLEMGGEKIHVPEPDRGRLYSGFLADVTVYFAPFVLPLVAAAAAYMTAPSAAYTIPAFLGALGLALALRAIYSYPPESAERRELIEMLEDPYTSPVRGKKIVFEGKIIGRGVPGYIFGEDMAATDSKGIIFVNYESWLPLFGNLFFAITKVKALIGKNVRIEGWYFRSIAPWLDLDRITNGARVKSYPYLQYWFGASLSIMMAAIIFALL